MKAIVFLGTQKSGSSRDAIKAAKLLGYETILLTNRISQLRNQEEYPDVTEMVYCNVSSISDVRDVIKELQNEGVEIATIISFMEMYGYIASVVASEFGIGCFTSDAIVKMQNKSSSRECLKDTSYCPWFQVINRGENIPIDEIEERLPLIIKNPHSTGSKDVYLINNLEDFFDKIDSIMDGYHNDIIIEEYLDGPQFLVETLVVNQEVKIIAIILQDIYLYRGHSIVTGYHLKHDLQSEMKESLEKAVSEIVLLHGMDNGACHLELRYVDKEWKLIEINPRISGSAMNDIILYGLGINLAQETLKLALKEPCELTPKYELYIDVQYLVSLVTGRLLKVTGRKEAINSKGVIKVFIKPRRGNPIYPPTSMGYRYAYVIANGLTEQEAKVNATIASNKIKFHVLKE